MVSKFPFFTESGNYIVDASRPLGQFKSFTGLACAWLVHGLLSEMELEGMVEKTILPQERGVGIITHTTVSEQAVSKPSVTRSMGF